MEIIFPGRYMEPIGIDLAIIWGLFPIENRELLGFVNCYCAITMFSADISIGPFNGISTSSNSLSQYIISEKLIASEFIIRGNALPSYDPIHQYIYFKLTLVNLSFPLTSCLPRALETFLEMILYVFTNTYMWQVHQSFWIYK